MRAALLLVVTLTAVSACTPADGTPAIVDSPAAAAPNSPAPTTSQPPGPPASPATAPAPDGLLGAPAPSPSAGGATAAGTESAAAPSEPAPPTPASVVDPDVLGGPAPVGSFVLGDSISLSAGIGPVLARYGYPVVGMVGQSASDSYLTMHLSSPAAQAAPAWVIELGTNNRGDATTVSQLQHWIDLIDGLRTPGARQQVMWVTPHRPAAYTGGSSAWSLGAFNAELSRLANEHRWLRVLDYDGLAKAQPDWFDEDAAMHLHPDAEGQAALVRLIAGPTPAPAPTPATLTDAGVQLARPSPVPEFENDLDEPPAFEDDASTPPPGSALPSPEPSDSPTPAS